MIKDECILQFFPEQLREVWSKCRISWITLQEIRIRVNQPVMILADGKEYILCDSGKIIPAIEAEHNKINSVIYKEKELEDIFRFLCKDSVYAYEEERRMGIMIMPGGHRIGIAGELVYTEGREYILKYIRYINIRLAHELIGLANETIEYLYETEEPLNTLIISPPGGGKTSLLRDIIRLFSDGSTYHKGCNVGVIDERGEIAGAYRGSATQHCGIRTDVLTGGKKRAGIAALVRTFTPRVVAIDEIGGQEDAQAILYAGISGCSILATIHGRNLEDIRHKEEMKVLLQKKVFQRILIITKNKKGERELEIRDGEGNEICGRKQLQGFWSC